MKLLLKITECVLVLTFICCLFLAEAETVVSVHDGDSFTLEDGRKIRIFGIDAPEIGQRFSESSRLYLENLVLGKNVSLDCFNRSWKRHVCVIQVNGISVTREMLRNGMAYEFVKYSKGQYKKYEKLAQQEHRGLWGMKSPPIPPWEYRRLAK